jgi:hypothetical protein
MCNRSAIFVQSPWMPRKRYAITMQSPSATLAFPLRPHYGLTALSRRSRRLYCVGTAFPLRFSKDGDPTAFVICSRAQTPSLGVFGDCTAFCGDATAMLTFYTAIWWRSRSPWERRPSVTGVLINFYKIIFILLQFCMAHISESRSQVERTNFDTGETKCCLFVQCQPSNSLKVFLLMLIFWNTYKF